MDLLALTGCFPPPASLALKLQTGNKTAKKREKALSRKGKHLPLGRGAAGSGVMTKMLKRGCYLVMRRYESQLRTGCTLCAWEEWKPKPRSVEGVV